MELQAVNINIQFFPEIMVVDFESRLRLGKHIFIDGDVNHLREISQPLGVERASGCDDGKQCQAHNSE
jgi:hypothetical protein